MIYHLSNNAQYGGWAIASRQYVADSLDLSKQSVINIIESLVSKGLMVRNDAKFLRASEHYCEMMGNKQDWIIVKNDDSKMISGRFTDGKESLPSGQISLPEVVKKVYQDGKESLPNNNTNNNKDNNTWSNDHSLKDYIISNGYKNITKLEAPSPDECDKIILKFTKLNFTEQNAKLKIIEFVDQMENYKPLLKRYTSFYHTIKNWIQRSIDNDSIKVQPKTQDIAANF